MSVKYRGPPPFNGGDSLYGSPVYVFYDGFVKTVAFSGDMRYNTIKRMRKKA